MEENEQIVQYALEKRRNVKIVDSGIEVGRDAFKSFRGKKFDDRMHLAKRIYPHVHNMDGFFFCKLKVNPPVAKSVEVADARSKEDTHLSTTSVTQASPGLAPIVFDDAEDASLIERSQQKNLNKKKRLSKGAKTN